MIVSVTLMDGRALSLPVDSASTSKEVCQILSHKLKLKDSFGFSLYVAMYEKVYHYIIYIPTDCTGVPVVLCAFLQTPCA